MTRVEVMIRRFDQFQQRHAVMGFPLAVFQKFGNDQAGAKAAQVAYYALFALFPLLLLLATVLGFVLSGDPNLQHEVLNSALANFPIIGTQLKNETHPLEGSGLALAIGIIGLIYGSLGVAQAAQNAMNTVWNIPFKIWPGLVFRHLRALAILALLGLGTIVSTFLANVATHVFHGRLATYGSLAGSVVVNFALFFAAFTVLTAESLGWRDVAPGVVLATIFWQLLQALGGFYVSHVIARANDVYGFFALVIGLLSFLFMAAQLTLLAAEINVVLRYRLWPRSLTQPPFTRADKETFTRLGEQEVRRPEMAVSVAFSPEADRQPLPSRGRKRAG